MIATNGLGEDEVLRLAASAERTSEHPLGEAIVRGAKERGSPLAEAEEFSATSGGGVEALVEGPRYPRREPEVPGRVGGQPGRARPAG